MKSILKFERDFLGGKLIHINERRGDTSFELHRHEYYEIIFYLNCNGVCYLNGTERMITDSCLFLLTPKDFHKIVTNNTQSSQSVIISFSEALIDKELIKVIALSPRVCYQPKKELLELIRLLTGFYREGGRYGEIKQGSVLNAVLCLILEQGEAVRTEAPYLSPAVGKAISLVLSDPAKSFSLAEISHECGISESYFSYLFHNFHNRYYNAG